MLHAASSAIQAVLSFETPTRAKHEICTDFHPRALRPARLQRFLIAAAHLPAGAKGAAPYMDESASREEEKAFRESFVGLRVALPDYQGGGHGVIKAVVGQVVQVVVGDDNVGWKRNEETVVTSHPDELEEAPAEEGK